MVESEIPQVKIDPGVLEEAKKELPPQLITVYTKYGYA